MAIKWFEYAFLHKKMSRNKFLDMESHRRFDGNYTITNTLINQYYLYYQSYSLKIHTV